VTFELHQDDTFWRESRVREASSMKPNDNVSSKKLMGLPNNITTNIDVVQYSKLEEKKRQYSDAVYGSSE